MNLWKKLVTLHSEDVLVTGMVSIWLFFQHKVEKKPKPTSQGLNEEEYLCKVMGEDKARGLYKEISERREKEGGGEIRKHSTDRFEKDHKDTFFYWNPSETLTSDQPNCISNPPEKDR